MYEYGINNVTADYMIHVCTNVGKVYIYETDRGREAIDSGEFPRRTVRDKFGRKTAYGNIVPVDSIPGMSTIDIPKPINRLLGPKKGDSKSEMGNKAARIAAVIIHRETLHGATSASHVPVGDPRQMQGIDLVTDNGITYEVKLDKPGGEKGLGGTGNLFLQTHERNYYQQH